LSSVVATDLAGIPEIVHQNENGFLVPEKNPAQLADAIFRIAADVQLSSRFRGASRRIAEEKFALSKTVGLLRALFGKYGLDV
jgi:colanic acid/amylovoran biosynthesis glycosyltransferase